jgi:hypothetical protein
VDAGAGVGKARHPVPEQTLICHHAMGECR